MNRRYKEKTKKIVAFVSAVALFAGMVPHGSIFEPIKAEAATCSGLSCTEIGPDGKSYKVNLTGSGTSYTVWVLLDGKTIGQQPVYSSNGIWKLSSVYFSGNNLVVNWSNNGGSSDSTTFYNIVLPDDNEPPVVNLTSSEVSLTDGSVTINIDATDNMGVTSLQIAPGSRSNYDFYRIYNLGTSRTYTAQANGWYTVIAKDAVGNTTYQDINITNSRSWVNPGLVNGQVQTVSLGGNVPGPDALYNVLYAQGTGELLAQRSGGDNLQRMYLSNLFSIDRMYFNHNDLVVVYRNKSLEILNVTFKNMAGSEDTTAPTITLSQTPESPVNDFVTIHVNATDDTGVTQMKWAQGEKDASYFASNGTEIVENSFAVYENGTYTVWATDAKGNQAVKTITIANIDRVAPEAATFVADKTTITNENVTVTIIYPEDAHVKEYKIGASGTWMKYTVPVVAEQNLTIYARSIDEAGNMSVESSYEVNNIDKVAPTAPSVSVDGDKLTIIPGTDSSGIKNTQYQLNDGEWAIYTNVVTLPNGNYTINAKSIDNAGNTSPVTTITATVSIVDFSDAIKAVEAAEAAPSQNLIDVAQELINALPESPEKESLQERLDQVQKNVDLYNTIQDDINKMDSELNKGNVTYELLQEYKVRITELRDLVETLPSTMDKPNLHRQLDELYEKIILIEKVLTLSDGDTEEVDLGELEDEIGKLPDGDLKEELENQLEDAKNLQDAINKVKKAEETLAQEDVDVARTAVDKIPNGKTKDELNDRLDVVQKIIDQIKEATKQVERAEQTNAQDDVNSARETVSKLPDGKVKDSLNHRLNEVQKIIDLILDATKKVEQAEQSKSQDDVNVARDAVKRLPDGQVKDELNRRLDAIQKEIDETPITDIDLIKDPAVKTLLLEVKRYVEIAEKYQSRAQIVTAIEKVEGIPASIKSNPRYELIIEDLTKRVNKLKDDYNSGISGQESQQKQTLAMNYVNSFEKFKTTYYKNKAQAAVNELPEGKLKEELQARIDALLSK
ncbi:hypothetical protein NDS46_31315 (plasmid) [Paenibacillus thiaminolyticus]|uniref:OmpL47-type beta-barrel domain-containing protein n=1 Tax=Paenibacillus thiaminolyticus TaxID=49283 RepID=UPI00232B4C0A|nr:hypothetical protein [Paenibacillus thiaminolyticus]WCF11448.1 hypothetical protein NDS46_31315 [Paenibacillus thiaminolyticus]